MWIPPEEIERARQIDLLSYLETYEPEQLKRVGRNTYTTVEHDSMRISNGLWHWTSRRIGGKSALDFLVLVRGMTLPDAVTHLLGNISIKPPKPKITTAKKPQEFILPERNDGNDLVRGYLRKRGIDNRIIDYCINTKRLYEDKDFHNAVFVGFNEEREPKFASVRSTFTDYRIDVAGSDKRFSFFIPGNENKDTLHLFEAVIDLMSYGTLELMKNKNWRAEDMLSLGGVFIMKEGSELPLPLQQYLKNHDVKNIVLHFDNDAIGIAAAESLKANLDKRFNVLIDIPTVDKDLNDLLVSTILKAKRKEVQSR